MEEFLLDSEKVIQVWINRILDRTTAFEKTKDLDACQFCDFKVICHREI
jgi:ATP-dependent helicase/nuclease subunit B